LVPRYSDEGLPAFEELFLYACPKFISANPPPYDDQEQLAAYAEDPSPEPAQRHLALFLADVRAQAAVPTLRSFLKLYTSLDAAKLAGFLDADEEEMVQQMMAVKAASRSVSRVGHERNLLDGQMISTSDMDFVINEVSYRIVRSSRILCCFPDFGEFLKIRTWFTSPRLPSVAASRDGSYGMRSTRSVCWTASRMALYLFHPKPWRRRRRVSQRQSNKRRSPGALRRHRKGGVFLLYSVSCLVLVL
jgi:hypothetical protein